MNLKWVSLLRALGLVLVVIYHFFPSVLPGGFIGVDIFFVFSGYLIGSLLLQEFENTEKLSLPRFYHKRIRRLLPAALFMVMVTLSLLLLISPDFRASIVKQAAAVLGWCTNYYEISTGQSYENALLPHVFVHTWTLAVEMHFYLIWGAVIFIVIAVVRGLVGRGSRRRTESMRRVTSMASVRGAEGGRGVDGTRRAERRSVYENSAEAVWGRRQAEAYRRWKHSTLILRVKCLLGIVVLALIVFSYLHMRALAMPADDPSVAYFATTSHIYPLLIGAATALIAGFSETALTRAVQRIPLPINVLFSAISLLTVVYFAITLTYASKETYSYGILIIALLVALFLILARGMQARVGDEPAAIRYVADRSYSMYLFHWPLYIIVEQLLTTNAIVAPGTFAGEAIIGIFAIVATVVFSEVSYRCVEKPLRVRSARSASAPEERRVVPQGSAVAQEQGQAGRQVEGWVEGQVERQHAPQRLPVTREQHDPQRHSAEQAWQKQPMPRYATPKRRPLVSLLARAFVVLVVFLGLSVFSAQALSTAPRMSFIQQAYEHEVLLLNTERLDETGTRLASYEFHPIANTDDPGAIYATEEIDLETQKQTAEEQRTQAFENASYGSVEATYGSVTVIGDSVVMGAISALREALGGGYIDAEGSRRTEQIDPLLAQLEQDGLLGAYVVIGLATNVFNPESLDGARHIAETIGPGHRLVFITGYGHDGVYALNDTLWSLAAEYPYVTVADWYSVAAANPELLAGDHIHIGGNEEATLLYAACVVDAIERASAKPNS
jgi:peptidoglycan/LPS O-acetylase OafA/YrhL